MLWLSRITAVQDVASGLTLVSAFSDPHIHSHTWVRGLVREVVRAGDRPELGKRKEGAWRGKNRTGQEHWPSEGNYFWEHVIGIVY